MDLVNLHFLNLVINNNNINEGSIKIKKNIGISFLINQENNSIIIKPLKKT